MKTIQIGSQWYVVRDNPKSKTGFSIISGPYAEQHWAVSAERLNEI